MIYATCLLLVSVLFTGEYAPDELTIEEYRKLHSELTMQDETWKAIPWHADLISAQHQAAEENKPIFIWAMDGHPLGCT